MTRPWRHFLFLLPLVLGMGGAVAGEPLILTPEDALARVKAGDLTLIDVRRPDEWQATGMPQGSVGVTWDAQAVDGFIAQVEALAKGDKTAPLAVICRSGNRSARAQAALAAAGFTNVYDVSTGVVGAPPENGWIGRGLPVTMPGQED
ncbi:MAG: rhodanese-like domain-containing protein [Pseudomonadota bacterium]